MSDGMTSLTAVTGSAAGTSTDPGEGSAAPQRRLTLAELADLAGMTARNVRAYQQRGLVEPPMRQGRKAFYTWDHLTRLRIVAALHDHGLTLKVIKDLIDRGSADSELVRLGREDVSASWSQSVRVPMADVVKDWISTNIPQDVERLLAVGLVEPRGDQLFANAAGLGIAASLSRKGVTPDVSARVAISAGAAATGPVQTLLAECEDISKQFDVHTRREIALLLMQLAATSFADIVHTAILECLADSAPGED